MIRSPLWVTLLCPVVAICLTATGCSQDNHHESARRHRRHRLEARHHGRRGSPRGAGVGDHLADPRSAAPIGDIAGGADRIHVDVRHHQWPHPGDGNRLRPARHASTGRLADHRVRTCHHRNPVRVRAVAVADIVGRIDTDRCLGESRLPGHGAGLSRAWAGHVGAPLPRLHHGRLQRHRFGARGAQARCRRLGSVAGGRGLAGRPGRMGRE